MLVSSGSEPSPILSPRERRDEFAEQSHVMTIDPGYFLDKVGASLVMGDRMVRFGDADLVVRTKISFATDHQGRDAGESVGKATRRRSYISRRCSANWAGTAV